MRILYERTGMCGKLPVRYSLVAENLENAGENYGVLVESFDKRLAAFLLEESALEETPVLKITHETIANHLGTAREVVTRMLRYFQSEGMVKLARGTVEITDTEKLRQMT